ncbi:MAG: SDR family oxidoreductase [Pseudomonadota bacterium]
MTLQDTQRGTELAGQVALVTGGSRGIGKAIALGLAGHGADVVICGRDVASLDATSTQISATGASCLTVQADVSRPKDLQTLMERVTAWRGQLNILVNNAVTSTSATFADLTDDDFRYHIDVKLMAYIRLCRLALPLMEQNGAGRIVNIGGMSARITAPLRLTNGVVNAGVANFTKQFATPAARANVTVNCVHPGYTATERVEQIFVREARETGATVDEVRAARTRDIPLGRLVSPDDLAAAVLFFCSPAAGMITGQCIAVDGGSGTAINY